MGWGCGTSFPFREHRHGSLCARLSSSGFLPCCLPVSQRDTGSLTYTLEQVQPRFTASYDREIAPRFHNQSRYSGLGSSRYGRLGSPGDDSDCENSLHIFDADAGTDWHDYADHQGVTVTAEYDEQLCPHRYNNKVRLWVPKQALRKDDPSTYVARARTLLPEERWIEHNQYPDSESP